MDTTVEHGTCSVRGLSVAYLTPKLFDYYWPQINEALDAEPELWDKAFTKENIYEGVHGSSIQPWVVFNGELIKLLFFTQRYMSPNGMFTLQVFWMYGTGLREVLPLIDTAIDQFAAMLNCSRIEVAGRKGWGRLLAPLGAEYQYSVYSRPVRKVRGN